MPCCCNQLTSCTQCCTPFPSEIQVSISSSSATICYGCSVFSSGLQFVCARSGNFSVSGSYTLTYIGSCIYRHYSCTGGQQIIIEVLVEIINGACTWVLRTLSVTKSLGSTNAASAQCTDCANNRTFLAGATFNGGAFATQSQCSGTGTISTTSTGGVGVPGSNCGGSIICSPIANCFSGSDTVASSCTPATISATVTLTI